MPPKYNSIPRQDMHNAIKKYSVFRELGWKEGTSQKTIAVYEIAHEGDWDLHFSVMFDPTGWNCTKMHFTLRKGPGKGKDAFAWFEIEGFNKDAKLKKRDNKGEVSLFTDPNLPMKIRSEVDKIDRYMADVFSLALTYIKV